MSRATTEGKKYLSASGRAHIVEHETLAHHSVLTGAFKALRGEVDFETPHHLPELPMLLTGLLSEQSRHLSIDEIVEELGGEEVKRRFELCIEACPERVSDLKFASVTKGLGGGCIATMSDAELGVMALITHGRRRSAFLEVLNTALLRENRKKMTPFVFSIWFALRALEKSPTYVDSIVYCGGNDEANIQSGKSHRLVSDSYFEGQVFQWSQFVSCVTDMKTLQSEEFFKSSNRKVIFHIELTTNRARVISCFTEEAVGSDSVPPEILLPLNSKFTVLKKSNIGEHMCIIHVRELPSSDPIYFYGWCSVDMTAIEESALLARDFRGILGALQDIHESSLDSNSEITRVPTVCAIFDSISRIARYQLDSLSRLNDPHSTHSTRSSRSFLGRLISESKEEIKSHFTEEKVNVDNDFWTPLVTLMQRNDTNLPIVVDRAFSAIRYLCEENSQIESSSGRTLDYHTANSVAFGEAGGCFICNQYLRIFGTSDIALAEKGLAVLVALCSPTLTDHASMAIKNAIDNNRVSFGLPACEAVKTIYWVFGSNVSIALLVLRAINALCVDTRSHQAAFGIEGCNIVLNILHEFGHSRQDVLLDGLNALLVLVHKNHETCAYIGEVRLSPNRRQPRGNRANSTSGPIFEIGRPVLSSSGGSGEGNGQVEEKQVGGRAERSHESSPLHAEAESKEEVEVENRLEAAEANQDQLVCACSLIVNLIRSNFASNVFIAEAALKVLVNLSANSHNRSLLGNSLGVCELVIQILQSHKDSTTFKYRVMLEVCWAIKYLCLDNETNKEIFRTLDTVDLIRRDVLGALTGHREASNIEDQIRIKALDALKLIE